MVVEALRLIVPTFAAGTVHGVVLKLDWLRPLARPIDGGCKFRGRPLFGENKTWRGPVLMIGVSAGVAAATGLSPWLGVAVGAAYSLAELPNSFVKRRLGIAPGRRSSRARLQYVVDQGDSVLGCTLALIAFAPDVGVLALVLAFGLALHAAFDLLLHAVGVKRVAELAT